MSFKLKSSFLKIFVDYKVQEAFSSWKTVTGSETEHSVYTEQEHMHTVCGIEGKIPIISSINFNIWQRIMIKNKQVKTISLSNLYPYTFFKKF
jgi:hypothetical protein